MKVIGVFNPGVTRLGDEIVLLLRVAEKPISDDPDIVAAAMYDPRLETIAFRRFGRDDPANDFSDPRLIRREGMTYLTSISHLRLARSKDGINFTIDPKPTISAANEYETFGIEDPRITLIDDTYYIQYVAVSPMGVVTSLIRTKDFQSFERLGNIFCPENKDVAIFPEKINGSYWALHRPHSPLCNRNDIWLARSPDLLSWGDHQWLMSPREGFWDHVKIGACAPPVRTDAGWLEIYHGVDLHHRYCLGAVLLDLNDPSKIISRCDKPVLEPTEPFEVQGFFANVVFTCGLLAEDNKLKIYYGVADSSIAYAEIDLQHVLSSLGQ